MEDTQLISLVRKSQAGDREAFGRLVDEFEPVVFAIVLRRLRHDAEAREVTQEVFLRALRKLDQLRDPERFVGWLKRIAVRLSINRAVRRPAEVMTPPDTFAGVDGSPNVPLENILRTERAHPGARRSRQAASIGSRNVDRVLLRRPVAQGDERSVRESDRHDQAATAHGPQPPAHRTCGTAVVLTGFQCVTSVGVATGDATPPLRRTSPGVSAPGLVPHSELTHRVRRPAVPDDGWSPARHAEDSRTHAVCPKEFSVRSAGPGRSAPDSRRNV